MDTSIKRDEIMRQGIRFPVSIKEYGINYSGISNSLSKPHGYKDLMNSIIKMTLKNPVQFETLIKRLVVKYNRTDIEDALEILTKDGVLQIESKNARPRKGNYFSAYKIHLDPRAAAELEQEEEVSEAEKILKLEDEINSTIGDTEHSLAVYLRKCIVRRAFVDSKDNIIAEAKAWVAFRSIAMTLAYSITLQERKEYMTLREISVKVWGESKRLNRYKNEITKAAGTSLSKLNINIMPEITYIYGDFQGSVNGNTLSGLSGYPVILADDTISNLIITEVNYDRILIVENCAVFLSIFNNKYINSKETLLMLGEGYLSSSKRQLLEKVLSTKPVPVYIWSDLDGDGLKLTLDIINFIKKFGASGMPILMGVDELKLSSGGFTGANHINLESDELRGVFHEVVDSIKEGRTMEQEELLLYYELIEKKLP